LFIPISRTDDSRNTDLYPATRRSAHEPADFPSRVWHGRPREPGGEGRAAGEAIDGLTGVELAAVIVGLGVPFDQVIWYAPERGGHVHVSYTTTRANRRETLHAPAAGDYVPWTPSPSPQV
jgi:hypothetical protein